MTQSLREEATIALFTYQLALEAELDYDQICRLNLEHGLCAFCSLGDMWELERQVHDYCREGAMMYMAKCVSDYPYQDTYKDYVGFLKICLQPRIDFLISLLGW